MFGDLESRNVSGLIVDNFYMTHGASNYYIAPGARGWFTEREAGFALIGIMAHYEATGIATYLNRVRDRVASLHRMQTENGGRAWVHNLYDHDPEEGCSQSDFGSSPWTSGLLLEGIVKYHQLSGDPVARPSVLMAVDDLRPGIWPRATTPVSRSCIWDARHTPTERLILTTSSLQPLAMPIASPTSKVTERWVPPCSTRRFATAVRPRTSTTTSSSDAAAISPPTSPPRPLDRCRRRRATYESCQNTENRSSEWRSL